MLNTIRDWLVDTLVKILGECRKVWLCRHRKFSFFRVHVSQQRWLTDLHEFSGIFGEFHHLSGMVISFTTIVYIIVGTYWPKEQKYCAHCGFHLLCYRWYVDTFHIQCNDKIIHISQNQRNEQINKAVEMLFIWFWKKKNYIIRITNNYAGL